MRRLLTGPLCGWPPGQITVVAEQRLPNDLPDRLVDLYQQAADVALFYYVGHGQIDDEDQLCLGLVQTRRQAERRATTSLTFAAVRRAVRASRAATKIVILDCCFAGQAVHGPHTLAGSDLDVAMLTSATGAYTLAATGPHSTAWFETNTDVGTPLTHFTRSFAEIIERGIPGEACALTLEPIYRQLHERLARAGKPVPSRSSKDWADTFVFARNAAPQPLVPVVEVIRPVADHTRRFQLLDSAEDAASCLDDPAARVSALTAIVSHAAADDPDRARRLLDDIERLAKTVVDPFALSRIWLDVLEAWPAITKILGRDHPGRLGEILDRAEAVATSDYGSDSLVRTNMTVLSANVAVARYSYDPVAAVAAARRIANPKWVNFALGDIADAAAAYDPEGAERIARIASHDVRASSLATIARYVLAEDPVRARRLLADARSAAQAHSEADEARAGIVYAIVRADRDNSHALFREAADVAESIVKPQFQVGAWSALATALAATAPNQARRYLDRALISTGEIEADRKSIRAQYLRRIVDVLAPLDLDAAERLARDITQDDFRTQALAQIVEIMAGTQPARAERIARRIPDLIAQAVSLARVAVAVEDDDPDNSRWLLENARRILAATERPGALVAIAPVLAAHHPDAAESLIVEAFPNQQERGASLAAIVEIVAGYDVDRATTLAASIVDPSARRLALLSVATSLDRAADGTARQ
jgi:hypothetical protein